MSILIGLVDQPVAKPENVGWETNRIGGMPAWLTEPTQPDPCPAQPPSCRSCGRAQVLIAQLYCPLGGSAFHRCLYVFACLSDCSSQTAGWCVLRSMLYDPTYDASLQGGGAKNAGKPVVGRCNQSGMDTDSWGDGADDWGVGGMDDWGDGGMDDWGYGGADNCEEEKSCIEEADSWGDEEGEGNWCKPGCPTTLSGKEGEGFNDDLTTVPVDQSSANYTANKGSVQAEIDPAATANSLSQMSLVDEPAESERGTTPISGAAACQIVEETGLLTDSGRWDAMAQILNTKHAGEAHPPQPPISSEAVTFRPFYLEVVEEPGQETADVSEHVIGLIREYERSEGHSISTLLADRPKSGRGKSGGSEGYEKSELRHGDRTFHKFLKRVQLCPEQCVRYDRGGDPLLVSDLRGQSIDLCPSCGAERVFELQLLPALIPWLQTEGAAPRADMDFGTVLVYTCKENCWPTRSEPGPQVLEEAIVLQADPDRHLYR